MRKIIIIKYGELTTKKGNIKLFINTLKDNIKKVLDNISYEEKHDNGRMYIIPNNNDDFDKIINKLNYVFGIHEINIGYESTDRDLETIGNTLLELLSNYQFNTFKVETKRSDKTYPINSVEFSKKIGAIILKNINDVTVDVNKPEILINIEIRRAYTYFYFEKIHGLGGYPVGVLGKGMLMLSGGIDSPVAGYLAIKRGVKLEALYFESPPHTSTQAKNKVIELARNLAKYNGNTIRLHVINFTTIQEEILKNIPHEYLITIMRRMMYRISAYVASNNNCKVIVNGESIGQVASQTLTSMSVINEPIKMPVIRPVACFDKLEIIDIAERIGTYETSILPYEDCCTIFVPDHPVINPDIKKCVEYESLIPYEDLIYQAIKGHEVIKVEVNQNNYTDLL